MGDYPLCFGWGFLQSRRLGALIVRLCEVAMFERVNGTVGKSFLVA